MAEELNDFFPATSTVGKAFLNLIDGKPTLAGVDDVSSMGGDYRNMKMVAFKGGVRLPAYLHPNLVPRSPPIAIRTTL